jgi:hypothetical protein
MLQQKVAKIFGGSKTNMYLCTRNSEIAHHRVFFSFAENDGGIAQLVRASDS